MPNQLARRSLPRMATGPPQSGSRIPYGTARHGRTLLVVEVTLLYFDGCPNWKVADERLERLARELPTLRITRRRVVTSEEAERLGFRGSPSILVDGVDVFAEPDAPVGLSCRVYATPDGPAGSPTLPQLREALVARS